MRELAPYVVTAVAALALAGLVAYSAPAREAEPAACEALRCIALETAGARGCVLPLERFYAVQGGDAAATAEARADFLQSCPMPPAAGEAIVKAVRRARPPGSTPLQATTPG